MRSLISLSAKHEELPAFSWYKYLGTRPKSVVGPKGKATLTTGDLYGLKAHSKGGRYYLVVPNMYHVNFTVEGSEVDALMKVSKNAKMPNIPNMAEGRLRAPRVFKQETNELTKNRVWDARYFKAARRINNETTAGIDFANYQWRKLVDPKLVLRKTQKVTHTIVKGDVFGVRFVSPSGGGIYIDQEGRRFTIEADLWEQMVDGTKVLPKSDWPEGKFTIKEMREAMLGLKNAKRTERRAAKRKLRELELAKKRAEEERVDAELKAKREAARQARKTEREKLAAATVENKIREAQKQKPIAVSEKDLSAKLRKMRKDEQDKLKKVIPEVEDFDEDALDADLDVESPPKRKDTQSELEFDPSVDSLSNESTDPVALLDSVIEEARSKSRKASIRDLQPEEGEEEDDEEEQDVDDSELEFDDEESEEEDETSDDTETEEDEPDEDEEPEEEEEGSDPDGEDEPSDEEPDEEDPEEDVEGSDADGEDEPSDDDDVDEEPDDEEEPEEEEEYQQASEGDVVIFKSDETDQREFILLSVYPFPKNNNIMIYKVYDTTTEPEGYHTVRVDTQAKASFEKMVTFVRKAEKKELKEFTELADGYERITDPIVS